MSAWMDIATAPTDQTLVWLREDSGKVGLGYKSQLLSSSHFWSRSYSPWGNPQANPAEWQPFENRAYPWGCFPE